MIPYAQGILKRGVGHCWIHSVCWCGDSGHHWVQSFEITDITLLCLVMSSQNLDVLHPARVLQLLLK